ncbi:MAG TPA: FeoB-associated Cys-rich membrane protein [Ruminococcus sp.]|nr:FeoB-associated Cys-rich membrane protein [Ruminococcus sp.]
MAWLSDNLMSIVLLLAVVLIVVFIIRSKIRTKKSGRGCGCAGCSGCSACTSGKSDRRKSAE